MLTDTDSIEIDGSRGEGGGQIIRSSLALSLVTGRPVAIHKIRAGRSRPGLKRQHVTAVDAAARIGCAEVSGAEIGSRELVFRPSGIFGGTYQFSVGSAGSVTLVLQTILPALILADTPSRLVLEGGTHNPWAPPFDFLQRSFLPLVNRLGPTVTAEIERYGFYPAGGGMFSVEIRPSELNGFDLLERGKPVSRAAIALVANLPLHIAQRETDTIVRRMDWKPSDAKNLSVSSPGPGNVVMIEQAFENVTEIATGFGKTGIRAEKIAGDVVRDARNYLKSSAPMGEHLTDQWMLPLALAVTRTGQSHSFRALPLSSHSITQLETLKLFLPIVTSIEAGDDRSVTVRISRTEQRPTATGSGMAQAIRSRR